MIYKLFIKILILSVIININLFCQINGKVIDSKTGEALVGANVLIKNSKIGTITDKNGNFTINNINLSKFTIVASYISYLEDSVKVDMEQLKSNYILKLKPSFLKMNEIVTTSTRTSNYLKNAPVSTYVINSEELESIGATDVSKALEWIGGLSINQSQYVTDLEVQGLSGKQVLVLIDGIKLIGKFNEKFDLSQIPSSGIERIEIVKGASSAIYGSEAMGGVVNIITKSPKDIFSFSVKSDYGSYGRWNSNLNAYLPFNSWKSNINLTYRRFDGYDMDKSTIWEDGSQYDKYDALIKVEGPLFNFAKLELSANLFKEDLSIIRNEIFKDYTYNKRNNFSIRVSKEINDISKINFNTEYSNYSHVMDEKVLSSGYMITGQETKNSLYRNELLYNTILNSHQLLFGYNYEHEKNSSDRISGGEKSTDLHSLFGQDEYKFNDVISFVLGLRYDNHSNYGGQLSPKFAFLHSPFPNLRVRLNYGSGFRAPSFKELFMDYYNEGVGYRVFGNPNLKPELSNSYSFNIEYWSNDDWQLKTTLFYNSVKDMIEYSFVEYKDHITTYKAQNVQKVKTWGCEFEFKISLFDFVEQYLTYNYTDTKDELLNRELSFRSKHRGNLITKFYLTSEIDLQLRQQFYSKQKYWGEDVAETTGEKFIEGKYLLYLYANFKLPYNLKIYSGINNLTNKYDIQWGPLPGREWFLGLQYNFK
ncbi:MAG TPA: TonB-dependent receptor [Bacteroidota bacterium]|nr:TonB-dependent receptor [Bacteroidota bacterium]